MSDLADRLRKAKKALEWCRDSCRGSRLVDEATADFPDPDAVGALLQHAWNTRQHAHNDDLDAALVKLED